MEDEFHQIVQSLQLKFDKQALVQLPPPLCWLKTQLALVGDSDEGNKKALRKGLKQKVY